ncbi:hypothetical protein Trydic_g5328 [Trypoxylus dichotomus]
MDGIFPALLQQGQDLLFPVLCTLLRATLAVGHLPSSWREAREVFIPKQGKTSYTEAKSYRPICLTSFLLKTLEKIIDKHLRDSALGRQPLRDNQYAYQSVKSCEKAIHRLARRAEIAFSHKEIALATFWTSRAPFTRRPSCQWSEPTLTSWITSMLNNRTVHVFMNLCNIGATVAAGCSQGGVLSPLLWCLLVDDLLSDLRRAGFYAQGYADNITIMVNGRFEGVISERMQVALTLEDVFFINLFRTFAKSRDPVTFAALGFGRRRCVLACPCVIAVTDASCAEASSGVASNLHFVTVGHVTFESPFTKARQH